MSRGYALDLLTPIRFVASELETATSSGVAVSVSDLALNYDQYVTVQDLDRIRTHELRGDGSNHEACVWLVGEALRELGEQVRQVPGGWQLAVPFDDVRHEGRPINRYGGSIVPSWTEHGLFDPMTGGSFTEDVRTNIGRSRDRPGDEKFDELYDSMKSWGWLTLLGSAIKDERGVVIVGHRRLTVAKELDLPVRESWLEEDRRTEVIRIPFGVGDEGDVERVKLAVASNLGGKPFTSEDRKRLARVLYGSHEWKVADVAAALKVSRQTVSTYLQPEPGAEMSSAFTSPPPPRTVGPLPQAPSEGMTEEILGCLRTGGVIPRAVLMAQFGATQHSYKKAKAEAERQFQAERDQQVVHTAGFLTRESTQPPTSTPVTGTVRPPAPPTVVPESVEEQPEHVHGVVRSVRVDYCSCGEEMSRAEL